MRPPRLAAQVLVTGLLRIASGEGGTGAVLARGDADAGGIVVLLAERGRAIRLLERGSTPDGAPAWLPRPLPGGESGELDAYLDRRRARDPDLWIVELDVADSERFGAAMTAAD